MDAGADATAIDPPRRGRDRLAAGFLLVVLGIGTLVLCIGIPVGCLWLASKVTDSIVTHYLVALPLTLVCMGVFAALLYRVDRLYLRVTGVHAPLDHDDSEEEPGIPHGPFEPMIIVSLVIALVALVVWFLFFAENPSSQFL
jgi:hypothetical protein